MEDTAGAGRTVLVGVDEGREQRSVVRYAARQAALHAAALHLVHVVRPEASGKEALRAGVEREATVVEPLAQLIRTEFPDLAVSSEAVSGQPAAVLIDRSSHVTQLVVGHRGSGGFPRLPLGSVSWQVATHAACPVIVVRPGEEPERADAPNRVAVGVDVVNIAGQALDQAYREAELRGAHLTLLHANFHLSELPTGPAMAAPNFEALDAGARRVLTAEAVERRERHPDVEVGLRVERVRASTLLTEASRRSSLLVVGSHGRTGLQRLILGSVSAEVLHTASCPVMVVPLSAGA
ncbi:Universal stress protein [Streptomyces sp. YIM 130001]|uniref:universal stress protein n=1 Tax=Streptomyces sp. YIM 130001 TaxID=2259644 RepID=UPI000E64A56C|nr:universal stress protein [Streptomyces sp. YIM 130001]RII20194.1 Universal stress protein [Streptomyces sp. YIM 130001]